MGIVSAWQTKVQAEDKLPVVATFSILADFARNVGGGRIVVTELVGPNGDTHVYQPRPADAQELAGARLILVNGLGLEGWIDRLIRASGTKAPVAVATKGIKPQQMNEEGRIGTDPHAWQSIANAKIYVANIRDALIAADPEGASAYRANADDYLGTLDALDKEVSEAIAAIPPERRQIITTHDAFGYFGTAYGFRFVAPMGISTETEACARDVAKIIRQIKAQKIPAVFLENVTDTRLLQTIAAESGAKNGGTLYSDALSVPDGPAGTYIEMMHNNVRELSAALKD
ncbi:metal ABC transporter substrate-binding protein [Methylocapsa sp. D3K7]|uniref:metal ABC transporter substrate-binding protein n=1 Tax=Methylocapsa sp. D3K7 TaxID=3041435 RepID=UPI00244E88E2|nr:metal ABC transporter substrate-binding protein [Methylocapsa sp. D3K7]WGJ16635.1 metal ABC transporter substrate-binding protein [Methylocapsa sp. D3K7]